MLKVVSVGRTDVRVQHPSARNARDARSFGMALVEDGIVEGAKRGGGDGVASNGCSNRCSNRWFPAQLAPLFGLTLALTVREWAYSQINYLFGIESSRGSKSIQQSTGLDNEGRWLGSAYAGCGDTNVDVRGWVMRGRRDTAHLSLPRLPQSTRGW